MSFKKIDLTLGEKVMGYTVEDRFIFENGRLISFQPTTNLTDVYKLIAKIQEDDYAWMMRMVTMSREIEVQIGKHYDYDVSITLAICKVAAKYVDMYDELFQSKEAV